MPDLYLAIAVVTVMKLKDTNHEMWQTSKLNDDKKTGSTV
jgi:hypothetical protein